jgi:hypothetical protein
MEHIEVRKLLITDELPSEEVNEIVENKSLNDITLRFMMNRELYENYILSKSEQTKEDVNEEKRFYRSRIFQLSKVLLLNDKERERYFLMNPDFDISKISFDVFLSFDNFVKNAIQNFKNIDTTDVLQSEFPIFEEPQDDYEDTEVQMYTPKQNTLDNFIITKKEEIILPKEKFVDLSDPKFKKKGFTQRKTDNAKASQ